MMTPKELAVLAAKALDEKKGKEIAAIEITEITTLADYFVSYRQLQHPDQCAVRRCGKDTEGAGRRAAAAPGGLSGWNMGAVGLRLRLRPCVQRRGPCLLRFGAPVGGRKAAGPLRCADKGLRIELFSLKNRALQRKVAG